LAHFGPTLDVRVESVMRCKAGIDECEITTLPTARGIGCLKLITRGSIFAAIGCR
jgi:hypothetical protein